MEYKINKKRLPRKNDDISNIRSIVLGVLYHFKVSAELLNVSVNRYETYIDALIEAKVLLREKNTTSYDIENFLVFDSKKVDDYKKSSFYKFIENKIVPFIKGAKEVKSFIK